MIDPSKLSDDEAIEAVKQLAIDARTSVQGYCDLMLAAEGHVVVPHEIHWLMHEVIDKAAAVGKHAVIVMPPEHGKTQQVAKRMVWELGRNPDLRIGLVSGDIDLAKRNLIATRKALLSNINSGIFPALTPDLKASKNGGEWSKERLYLAGKPYPAFEVFPLDGSVEGVRLDRIWLDDAVTRKCHRSEAERERAHSAIHGTWLSRITAGGHAIVTNNVWHRQDPIHLMAQSPSFVTLWVGYVETDELYWRIHHAPDNWTHPIEGRLPLWPVWDKPRLEARRHEDRLTFKRLYGGKALLAEETRFPPVDEWHTYETLDLPAPGGDERIVAFLDPAGGKGAKNEDFAALSVVLISAKREMFLLDCWIQRAVPQDQAAACWEMHRKVKHLGYRGIDRLEVEMLPKDELWMQGPLQDHQAELKRRGDPDWKLWWTVRHPREHKHSRIERINPHIRNGWLKFPKGFSAFTAGEDWQRLVSMTEDFPFADHDDAPDSLSGAVTLAEEMGAAVTRPETEAEAVARVVREGREARRENVLAKRDWRIEASGGRAGAGQWGFK
ncbi:MAG: hypothetical protein ABFD89_04765 [Bryobacteraceae bacterium]